MTNYGLQREIERLKKLNLYLYKTQSFNINMMNKLTEENRIIAQKVSDNRNRRKKRRKELSLDLKSKIGPLSKKVLKTIYQVSTRPALTTTRQRTVLSGIGNDTSLMMFRKKKKKTGKTKLKKIERHAKMSSLTPRIRPDASRLAAPEPIKRRKLSIQPPSKQKGLLTQGSLLGVNFASKPAKSTKNVIVKGRKSHSKSKSSVSFNPIALNFVKRQETKSPDLGIQTQESPIRTSRMRNRDTPGFFAIRVETPETLNLQKQGSTDFSVQNTQNQFDDLEATIFEEVLSRDRAKEDMNALNWAETAEKASLIKLSSQTNLYAQAASTNGKGLNESSQGTSGKNPGLNFYGSFFDYRDNEGNFLKEVTSSDERFANFTSRMGFAELISLRESILQLLVKNQLFHIFEQF